MVQDAELDCDNPHRFDDLINEQTPGGLNEQVSARPIYGFEMMIISFLIVCSIRVHLFLLYILRFAELNPFVKALRNLNILGVFDSYDKAMDATLSRLRGESDGSLQPSPPNEQKNNSSIGREDFDWRT
jgi:hypothetical protein